MKDKVGFDTYDGNDVLNRSCAGPSTLEAASFCRRFGGDIVSEVAVRYGIASEEPRPRDVVKRAGSLEY